jgi:hypothetical protein
MRRSSLFLRLGTIGLHEHNATHRGAAIFDSGDEQRIDCHDGHRAGDGLGAGAYTTTVSLYSQYYLWMLNGRVLRNSVTQRWVTALDVLFETAGSTQIAGSR